MMRWSALAVALAGLALGPLALALHIEFGTFLPALYCGGARGIGIGMAVLLLAVALGGAALSWRRRGQGALRFMALLSALVAGLMALPLLLQLLALLLLDACAR